MVSKPYFKLKTANVISIAGRNLGMGGTAPRFLVASLLGMTGHHNQLDAYQQFEEKEGNMLLKEGDRAPSFTTVDQAGVEVSLTGLLGKKVWLWFFSSPGGGN